MMPSRHREDPNQPFPSLGASFLLILVAIFASVFTGVAFFGLGALAAYGIGRAIGVGAVASLAAQRVGEPQTERLGLRRLEPEAIPVILCLVPAMLLLSELDNYAYDWVGDEPNVLERLEQQRSETNDPGATGTAETTPDGESDTPEAGAPVEAPGAQVETTEAQESEPSGDFVPEVAYDDDGRRIDAEPEAATDDDETQEILDPEDPVSLLQAFVVMVGIIPIVDCFLVFGVIQQGLVRRMGAHRGIAFAALFWMLLRPVPLMGTTQFFVVSLGTLGLGGLLGLVRVATASIAGPMLLASGWAAVQFVALATLESIPLPGLNVPGTHLPLLVVGASLVTVGWAAVTLYRAAEPALAAPPVANGRTGRATHSAEIRWFPGYEEQQGTPHDDASEEDDGEGSSSDRER
jgi:hypothetical protein